VELEADLRRYAQRRHDIQNDHEDEKWGTVHIPVVKLVLWAVPPFEEGLEDEPRGRVELGILICRYRFFSPYCQSVSYISAPPVSSRLSLPDTTIALADYSAIIPTLRLSHVPSFSSSVLSTTYSRIWLPGHPLPLGEPLGIYDGPNGTSHVPNSVRRSDLLPSG
jgi:hypothetical protein